MKTLPWEETDQYIRSGHRRPEDFESDSFRTIILSEDEGIKAVIGKLKGEESTAIQSYLFDLSKGWTLEKAKAWFERRREALVKEHFRYVLPFQIVEKIVDRPLRIRGVALTVGMSRNRNIYTPEELARFAAKLEGSPLYVEHVAVPNAVGKVVKTEFDSERLWYEAEVYDDEVAEKIRKGMIRHVSVGADYQRLDVVDGKIPYGLHNAELSLVAVPGVPESNIQVLESLTHQPEASPEMAGSLETGGKMSEEKKEGDKPTVLPRLTFERVWTARYKNDLPDDAYALILPGGEKDETGRTKPRTLRLFPYKNADGKVDLPHLRNANARVCQMIKGSMPRGQATVDQLEKAQRRLVAVKKKLGIGAAAEEMKLYEQINADEEVPEKIETLPEPSSDEFLASLEDVLDELYNMIEDLQARLEKLERGKTEPQTVAETRTSLAEPKAIENIDRGQPVHVKGDSLVGKNLGESLVQKPKEPMMPVSEVIKMFESVLLSPSVERSSLHEQLHHQQIRRIIWKLKERMKNG